MRLLRMAVPSIGLLILMFADQDETLLNVAYGFLVLAVIVYAMPWLSRPKRNTGYESPPKDP